MKPEDLWVPCLQTPKKWLAYPNRDEPLLMWPKNRRPPIGSQLGRPMFGPSLFVFIRHPLAWIRQSFEFIREEKGGLKWSNNPHADGHQNWELVMVQNRKMTFTMKYAPFLSHKKKWVGSRVCFFNPEEPLPDSTPFRDRKKNCNKVHHQWISCKKATVDEKKQHLPHGSASGYRN